MSVVLFRRPARRRGPVMPSGELTLQEPPTLQETVPDTSAVWTYMPMAMMSVSMMLMFLRTGGQGNGVFMYIALGMMVLAAAAMMVGQVMRKAGDRKQRLRGERRDYLRYLAVAHRAARGGRAAARPRLAPSRPPGAALHGAHHPAVGTPPQGRGLR